ncbi:MAG TPA: MFS transporter [Anaerolineales bacterium]|nr:MFS transporter [Anaerolineales bacterium]
MGFTVRNGGERFGARIMKSRENAVSLSALLGGYVHQRLGQIGSQLRIVPAVVGHSHETFASLYIRNYRLYYIGQIISNCGTFMQSVAQAWLILQLTHSGIALGITSTLQYLPFLLLGPYGGLVADRFPKRKILYITQSLFGLLALTLGALVATGRVQVWMVYVLAACLGLVTVFDNPARQTFYMEMVGPDHLRNAVTLYSILVNVARMLGPTLAAALIAGFGLAPCFVINGLSYGMVVIMLAMMNTRELLITPPLPRAKGQILEGLKYVLSTPIVGFTLLMMAVIGTFTYEFHVSLPLIAQNTFKGDPSSYAFLTAAMGLGATAGGILFASRKGLRYSSLVGAGFLFGLAVLAAAWMPSLLLTGAVMVLVGIFSINFSSLGNSLLQLESSPQMRGRVMSFWSIAFLGSTTIGAPVVGWFAEVAGARWGLAFGGIAALLGAALGALTLRRKQG